MGLAGGGPEGEGLPGRVQGAVEGGVPGGVCGVWVYERGLLCVRPGGWGGRDLGHTVGGWAARSGAGACGIGAVLYSLFFDISGTQIDQS